MKRLAVAIALFATPALAQQPAPPPPIVIDAPALKQLTEYLAEQPFKFSAPIMSWLVQAQAKAQAAVSAPAKKDGPPAE